ncbi:MAG: type II toxin-antitoxin system RelE/ParE family toxin [Candidatus Binatia bacterium]
MGTSEPEWHPEAIQEAEDARNWYGARSPLAARGFLLELQTPVNAVSEAPARWPRYLHGTRRCLFFHRYPYAIVYLAGPPLFVVAVVHDKRRPGYWRGRIGAA